MTIGEDNHADDDDVDNNSGRGCAPKYDNCCTCMLRMLWISCLDNSKWLFWWFSFGASENWNIWFCRLLIPNGNMESSYWSYITRSSSTRASTSTSSKRSITGTNSTKASTNKHKQQKSKKILTGEKLTEFACAGQNFSHLLHFLIRVLDIDALGSFWFILIYHL